jgi:hypothetical protein
MKIRLLGAEILHAGQTDGHTNMSMLSRCERAYKSQSTVMIQNVRFITADLPNQRTTHAIQLAALSYRQRCAAPLGIQPRSSGHIYPF